MGRIELNIPDPNPKQALFFEARARYIAYGGARAGGKSWAMRVKFVQLCLRYAGIQILLLRRTLPELTENHVNPLLPQRHSADASSHLRTTAATRSASRPQKKMLRTPRLAHSTARASPIPLDAPVMRTESGLLSVRRISTILSRNCEQVTLQARR